LASRLLYEGHVSGQTLGKAILAFAKHYANGNVENVKAIVDDYVLVQLDDKK